MIVSIGCHQRLPQEYHGTHGRSTDESWGRYWSVIQLLGHFGHGKHISSICASCFIGIKFVFFFGANETDQQKMLVHWN